MKKFLVFYLFLLLLFLIPNTAYGANLCTVSKYDELKERASIIEMKWELKFDENNIYYFEVSAENVDKDLILKFGQVIYEPKNGKILVNSLLEGGRTYQFKFYGGYAHSCVEEYVYTKVLEIPKYNKYSEFEICKGHEKWAICDKWYSGSFSDEEDFYLRFEEYKKKVESGEIVVEDEKGSRNYLILIFVVVIFVFMFFFMICKKKKRSIEKKKSRG